MSCSCALREFASVRAIGRSASSRAPCPLTDAAAREISSKGQSWILVRMVDSVHHALLTLEDLRARNPNPRGHDLVGSGLGGLALGLRQCGACAIRVPIAGWH